MLPDRTSFCRSRNIFCLTKDLSAAAPKLHEHALDLAIQHPSVELALPMVIPVPDDEDEYEGITLRRAWEWVVG